MFMSVSAWGIMRDGISNQRSMFLLFFNGRLLEAMLIIIIAGSTESDSGSDVGWAQQRLPRSPSSDPRILETKQTLSS